jgi:hypothetical protein
MNRNLYTTKITSNGNLNQILLVPTGKALQGVENSKYNIILGMLGRFDLISVHEIN